MRGIPTAQPQDQFENLRGMGTRLQECGHEHVRVQNDPHLCSRRCVAFRLFAGFFAGSTERAGESLVALDARFFHLVEHVRVDVLGRDRELTAGVMLRQLTHELRAFLGQIVANAGGDEDATNALLSADFAEQTHERTVIGTEIFADLRVHAR